MKRIVSFGIAVIIFAAVCIGCSGKKDRVLYNEADLSEIVKLGEYKNLPVDTSSETFKEFYQDVLESDVNNNDFFSYNEVSDGKIEEGDIANIDYAGKKDGVAFQGGTDKGYDLEIGSGSFIDGFEDGLIGAAAGETVVLNLTFPESYSSAELAGEDVVFTVKVNSIKRKTVQTPEEYYSKLGFKSVSEYNSDAEKRAVENYLVQTIVANSEIKEYPQADIDIIYSATKNAVEMHLKEQYNTDFASYLSSAGQTEAQYKENLTSKQIKPATEVQMVLYAILDAENIPIPQEEIDRKIDEVVQGVNNSSVTADTVKSVYGEYYFEEMIVTEKVMDFVYKNAEIK